MNSEQMIIQNCMRMIGCGVEFLGPQEFYTHRSSGVRGGLSPDWTTGPLPLVRLVWFQPDPSLVACLALPINPLLSGRPRKAPNHTGDRMTCDMAANSTKEPFRVFQQLSHSHKRTMSCKPQLRGKGTIGRPKPVLYTTQWAERYSYM